MLIYDWKFIVKEEPTTVQLITAIVALCTAITLPPCGNTASAISTSKLGTEASYSCWWNNIQIKLVQSVTYSSDTVVTQVVTRHSLLLVLN